MKLIQVEFSRNTSFIYIEILKPLCKTFQSKGAGKKKTTFRACRAILWTVWTYICRSNISY